MLALLFMLVGAAEAATAATGAAPTPAPSGAAPTPAVAYSTCDTGASRLLLATNLANLPKTCMSDGHTEAAAAAVFECFASSRVIVRGCRVTVLPGKAASKGLDCRVMHAQGRLTTGPGNASLTAVLDGVKVAALLHANHNKTGSPLLQGVNSAAKLQQQLVRGLQLLFAHVVVRNSTAGSGSVAPATAQGVNNTAAAAATGTAGAAASAAKPLLPRARHQGRGRHRAAGHAPGANATAADAHSQQQQQKRRKGGHRGSVSNATVEPSSGVGISNRSSNNSVGNSTDAAAGLPQARSAPAGNTSSSSTNSNSTVSTVSGGGNATSSNRGIANSTGAAANITQQQQGAVADNSKSSGGRRLRRVLDSTAGSANAASYGLRQLLAAVAAAATESGAADEDAAGRDSGSSGAVLYRQGSSIVLQPSNNCRFQFLVTRNPSLLQPDSQAAAAAASAAARAGFARGGAHSSSSSWWVSAGALFASVSAVLALAVCYMASQLAAKYKSYEALPSEQPGDAPQQQPGLRSSDVAAAGGYRARSQGPEMALELQQQQQRQPAASSKGSTRQQGGGAAGGDAGASMQQDQLS